MVAKIRGSTNRRTDELWLDAPEWPRGEAWFRGRVIWRRAWRDHNTTRLYGDQRKRVSVSQSHTQLDKVQGLVNNMVKGQQSFGLLFI